MAQKNGKLNNSFTRFAAFSWGDHPELRRAITEVREKLAAQGKPLPKRFKIKL